MNSMSEVNGEKRKSEEGLGKMEEEGNMIVYGLSVDEEWYYGESYNGVEGGRGGGDNDG